MLIIHYSEIGLKGRNRHMFEERLAENIKAALRDAGLRSVRILFGRILIETSDEQAATVRLRKIFGIAYVARVVETKPNIQIFKEQAWELAQEEQFESFKIATRRADKLLPFTSEDVNREVGAHIQQKSGARVQLDKPDLTIYIEALSDYAFLYTEKIAGPGGLPLGSSGKVVSLISSGIDSPVASWRIMKRGCAPVFVHFHSYPQTSKESLENVRDILNVLREWSPSVLKLYAVPFLEIQKLFTLQAPDKLRVVFYRRSMLRIAQRIAELEGAHALITGESVGQVASQTVENIAAINNAASMPVLRPNITDDKQDTIALAQRLGTYEISIRPYEDCCSLFVPAHPATKARLEDVKAVEKAMEDELRMAEESAIVHSGIMSL
jgi:tRNA uracil 4-sulfurtransferase